MDGTEIIPNKSLYYKIVTNIVEGKETRAYGNAFSHELSIRYIVYISEFSRNNKRALGALKSIILINNNERFKEKSITKDLYKAIITTFSQKNLELIGRYFNKIVDTNYNSFNNINKYTSNI